VTLQTLFSLFFEKFSHIFAFIAFDHLLGQITKTPLHLFCVALCIVFNIQACSIGVCARQCIRLDLPQATWNVFLLAWTHHCWIRLRPTIAEFTVTKGPKSQAANKSAWTRVHEALSAMFARHAINVLLLVMHTTSTAPVPTWLEQHAMLWTLKTARLLRAGEETSPPRFCALHDTCVEVNFAAGICTNMQNKDIPPLHKDIPSLHMHTPYYLCI
jgi:hypothetical protein